MPHRSQNVVTRRVSFQTLIRIFSLAHVLSSPSDDANRAVLPPQVPSPDLLEGIKLSVPESVSFGAGRVCVVRSASPNVRHPFAAGLRRRPRKGEDRNNGRWHQPVIARLPISEAHPARLLDCDGGVREGPANHLPLRSHELTRHQAHDSSKTQRWMPIALRFSSHSDSLNFEQQPQHHVAAESAHARAQH